MKFHLLSVLFLSAALGAGCSGGGSGSTDNGGVRGGCCGTNPTTTVGFSFDDFSGVSVSAPFVASIIPGPFSVQITVDSGVVDLLDVRKSGQNIVIGFAPGSNVNSETNKVEIAMPNLTSINLTDVAVATISGFSGSVLDVHLAGVSTLQGLDLNYDLLMADADAISVLLMEDVNPFPAADINVSDISSATVNLMNNAVLTGSATTTSSTTTTTPSTPAS